jgi:peptide/histidine transporter 3/4
MFYVGSFEVLRRNSGKLEFFNQTSGKYEPILDAGSQQPMNKLYWAAAIPNYVLVALAECLINVTAYDVFYNEVPLDLKSTCQAINLFMVAMGSNVTSIFTLLFQGFIPQDLNEGNLEYMYYALGGLSVFNVLAYVFVMHSMQFGMVPNEEDQDRGGVDDGDEARGSELCYINSHSSIESISLS